MWNTFILFGLIFKTTINIVCNATIYESTMKAMKSKSWRLCMKYDVTIKESSVWTQTKFKQKQH